MPVSPRVKSGHGVESRPMESKFPSRDRVQVQTPLRCPICDRELEDTLIRDIGGVTSDLVWQIHAGRCPEHGWFQTEVISRPPREIFPVSKPFGAARRVVIETRSRITLFRITASPPIGSRILHFARAVCAVWAGWRTRRSSRASWTSWRWPRARTRWRFACVT